MTDSPTAGLLWSRPLAPVGGTRRGGWAAEGGGTAPGRVRAVRVGAVAAGVFNACSVTLACVVGATWGGVASPLPAIPDKPGLVLCLPTSCLLCGTPRLILARRESQGGGEGRPRGWEGRVALNGGGRAARCRMGNWVRGRGWDLEGERPHAQPSPSPAEKGQTQIVSAWRIQSINTFCSQMP